MRIGPVVVLVLVGSCACLTQHARAFTLIERLAMTIDVSVDENLPYVDLVYGGYTDRAETQFFGGVVQLPAVQRTLSDNLVLAVPGTRYGFGASILMCDGSVRVGLGLNDAAAGNALGPPAQTSDQFFANSGTTESALIGLLVRGDQTALTNFYHLNLSRLSSPLTTRSDVIGFSIATLLGHEEVIKRPQGDANFDGTVNFTDLVALAAHYGKASGATWAEGDFNGDGKVNFQDLVILGANYGVTITPQPLAVAASPLPEPGAWGLLAGAGAMVLARGRR